MALVPIELDLGCTIDVCSVEEGGCHHVPVQCVEYTTPVFPKQRPSVPRRGTVDFGHQQSRQMSGGGLLLLYVLRLLFFG